MVAMNDQGGEGFTYDLECEVCNEYGKELEQKLLAVGSTLNDQDVPLGEGAYIGAVVLKGSLLEMIKENPEAVPEKVKEILDSIDILSEFIVAVLREARHMETETKHTEN